MYRLLSDSLLCWKEPILASYPFLSLLHKRSPRLHNQKIQAQNNRADPESITYTVVSSQFTTNSIFPLKPTLSRSLLQKFPVETFLTVRVHSENQLGNPASFANCTSPGTTPSLASVNCFRTTGAKWQCGPHHTNSYNFAMTVISQDDHLTAGAWRVIREN